MSGFWGMDPDLLRDHARRTAAGADRLALLAAHLDRCVGSAPWTGADADLLRARWALEGAGPMSRAAGRLHQGSAALRRQAARQDAASAPDRPLAPPDTVLAEGPLAPQDAAPAPGRPAGPAEGAAVAVRSGHGAAGPVASSEADLVALGAGFEDIGQLRRDAQRFQDTLEDWATGERVPTLAELMAGAALVAGSAGVELHEGITGEDLALLDDRPGGIVHAVRTVEGPLPAAASLQDLVLANDALRRDNPQGLPLDTGRIGIQELRTEGGSRSFIVQIPPTEGDRISHAPGAWGGQGASRDWASNLRLVAGQHPAAMDDVRAAMAAPGPDGLPIVPPGARVLLVGHSQGGIVAAHLAADPSFASASGAPGTYEVTHVLSMGSPVQTVLPALATTQVVSVTHGPLTWGPGGMSGDPIGQLDLQGLRADGGRLTSPQVHEVLLPGYGGATAGEWLHRDHDSVGPGDDPAGGYAGSIGRAVGTEPRLTALQEELTGPYLGPRVEVVRSHVVEVGRESRVPAGSG